MPSSVAVTSTGHAWTFLSYAIGSEDSGGADLIVRAVETRGERSSARIELPLVDRVLIEEFGPSQLRTFRVPRDPALPVVEVDLIEWPIRTGEAAPHAAPESGSTEQVGPSPEPGSEDSASAGEQSRAVDDVS